MLKEGFSERTTRKHFEARGELEKKDHSCFRISALALTAASAFKGLIEEAPIKAFLHLRRSSLVQKYRSLGELGIEAHRGAKCHGPPFQSHGGGKSYSNFDRFHASGNRLRDKL
jgi:hypothetical protein